MRFQPIVSVFEDSAHVISASRFNSPTITESTAWTRLDSALTSVFEAALMGSVNA